MPLPSTYIPIATQTLTASAATAVFSNIPQTYTDLVLVIEGTFTGTGTTNTRIRMNGDTATNYSDTWIGGSGSAAASGRQTSTDYIFIGGVDVTLPSVHTIHIMNYANTTTYKSLLSRYSGVISSGQAVSAWVGMWRNTAAITSLTTYPANSSWATGSTFTLYGIKAA